MFATIALLSPRQLSIFETISCNIINNPCEERYRRIRTSSETFQALLPAFGGCQDKCVALFVERLNFSSDAGDGFLVLQPRASLAGLRDCLDAVQLLKVEQAARDMAAQEEAEAAAFACRIREDEQPVRAPMVDAAAVAAVSRCIASLLLGNGANDSEVLPGSASGQLIWNRVKRVARDALASADGICLKGAFAQSSATDDARFTAFLDAFDRQRSQEAHGGTNCDVLSAASWKEVVATVDAAVFQRELDTAERLKSSLEASRALKRREIDAARGAELPGINKELMLTATRLVNDIAGLMEQHYILEGATSMMRQDRVKARELLADFSAKRLLVEDLHLLKEQWERKIEDTKRLLGKQTVFL